MTQMLTFFCYTKTSQNFDISSEFAKNKTYSVSGLFALNLNTSE